MSSQIRTNTLNQYELGLPFATLQIIYHFLSSMGMDIQSTIEHSVDGVAEKTLTNKEKAIIKTRCRLALSLMMGNMDSDKESFYLSKFPTKDTMTWTWIAGLLFDCIRQHSDEFHDFLKDTLELGMGDQATEDRVLKLSGIMKNTYECVKQIEKLLVKVYSRNTKQFTLPLCRLGVIQHEGQPIEVLYVDYSRTV
jgi:hypothetical protein